jgi:hypothetical protein
LPVKTKIGKNQRLFRPSLKISYRRGLLTSKFGWER